MLKLLWNDSIVSLKSLRVGLNLHINFSRRKILALNMLLKETKFKFIVKLKLDLSNHPP